MQKLLVLFCLSLVAVLANTRWFQLENYTFEKYVQEFNKRYSSAEEFNQRKSLFESRLKDILKHNNDTTKTWKRGINRFADRTTKEFNAVLGYRKDIAYAMKAKQPKQHIPQISEAQMKALPASVDWRTKNIISAVKDQGQCGSCWTFGTAETIESYAALKTGQLMDLSEQQILDCTPNPNDCGGTGGCGGGTPELAYARIMKMGGLTTEWMYSYNSYFGQNFNCQYSNNITSAPFAQLSNYVVLPSNQLSPVMLTLATVGPLAVNVDASAWQDYESGVFDGCNQANPDIDHVVQLVGYGTDTSLGDYWIVRNSWSTGWGEDGYIRLKRTATPRCGVDTNPQDGTGCNGGPSKVTVCGTCAILYDVSYPIIQ